MRLINAVSARCPRRSAIFKRGAQRCILRSLCSHLFDRDSALPERLTLRSDANALTAQSDERFQMNSAQIGLSSTTDLLRAMETANMITEVFITCALTGSGDAVERSPLVPVTPEQIAQSAIEATRAGAAVVHVHVRDPKTRRGSRDPALYRAVVDRIRHSDVNPVINLTAGMGGDLTLGETECPLPLSPTGTDIAGVRERLLHVEELRPEICTLDCGSMNWGADSQYVMVNTTRTLRAMAERVKELGVRPELEVFDAGQLVFVRDLIKEGLIDDPALIQLCMGIGYGAPNDLTTLMALVHQLPPKAIYSVFSIGRMQLPFAALAPLVGANVRVGLEDNLYLSRGRLATNAELTGRAVGIVERMGLHVMSPDQVRQKLAVKV